MPRDDIRLTRERIIRTAIELIEEDGVEALSMRGLATELGVAAMSLYNHVPGKAALLDGVAAQIMDGLELADDPNAAWQERARALVRAFRKVAHDNPRSVTTVLTRKIDSSAGLRVVERTLAIAEAAGFDGRTSVRIMRALLAYAIGAQMRETVAAKMLGYMGSHPAGRVDPADYPRVAALTAELAEHDPETDFEFGLDLLIGALEGVSRTP